MTQWSEPVRFTKESLAEEGIADETVVQELMVNIEFLSKNSVMIDGLEYSVYDEGNKEFASLIGLNFGYVNKLPDELFAITMNYFMRRGETMGVEVFVNADEVITGVHLENTYRMTFSDVFDMIRGACNKGDDLLISEYVKDGPNHVVTVLGEPVETEDGTMYPSLTLELNDRLQGSVKHRYGVFRWGPKMVDNHLAIETKIGKKETVEIVLERIEEDIINSYTALDEWLSHNVASASRYEIENPRAVFDKILREAKVNKKRDDVLDISEIFETPLSAYDVAIRLSDTASVEAISKNLRKKLEGLAGYALSHMNTDRRCKSCLSHLETLD